MKKLLIELNPQPTTVLELLSDPTRWGKGSSYRSEKDNPTCRDRAVACCIGGAMNFVYYEKVTPKQFEALFARARALAKSKGYEDDGDLGAIPRFNDDPSTTHADVIAFCKEANI